MQHFLAFDQPVFRLNTDEFPSSVSIDLVPSADPQLSIRNGIREIVGDQIGTVWFRRPLGFGTNRDLPLEARRFADDECEALFENLYQMVPNALWVSRPAAIRRVQRKLWQLDEAKRFGFSVPDTLVTTSRERFLSFWNRHYTLIFTS